MDREPRSSDEMLEEVRRWLASDLSEPGPASEPDAESRSGDSAIVDDPEPSAPIEPASTRPTATGPATTQRRSPGRTRTSPRPTLPRSTRSASLWDRSGVWALFGLVFLAPGIALLAWGFTQFTESAAWQDGVGTVVWVDRTDDGANVDIRYSVGEGTYEFTSTADERAQIGDVVEILVRPDDPSQATTQRDRITAFVLRVVFGGLLVLAAPVPIWFGRRFVRKRS